MNQLFKDLDETPADAALNGHTATGEAVEDIMENLEDELDALEEKEMLDQIDAPQIKSSSNGGGRLMDIEKPSYRSAYNNQAPKAAVTTSKSSNNDSFLRTLYTRQVERNKEKAFTFYSPELDNVDTKNYELDLHENKAQFYLIDIQEDFSLKSRVLVYGKVKVRGEQPVSCCLVVNNMERCYYFFKRENDQVVGFRLFRQSHKLRRKS